MWYASILIYQEKENYFLKKDNKKYNIMAEENKSLAAAMPAIGIGMDIANAVGGWFGGNERGKQQYKYQRKLNEQMAELQRQNWDYTNAENQRKHYENAGLNVGLMYGSSGGIS